ncbi:MAG: hypothetical protein IH843_03515 [Thaumarchaeota archaeon]|nr:hypothetical protein [Nitrososphaerota archaeon]
MSAEGKKKRENSELLSWTVFLVTLLVVLIAITTLLFPALVIRSLGGVEDYSGINPFETGIWTFPILITNFVLLGIGILYFKNKIPKQITKSIKFIFDFEVSAKIAFLVILILIGFYVVFTTTEVLTEDQWPDYNRVKSSLENWSITDFTKKFDLHVKYLLGNISLQVFGSYRVIPFMASIALLVLTYAITTEISKKRFAGLVSMVLVLQSGTFLTYDTSITYSNFWVLFYVLSLYLIYKKWPISPASFILSIFSKPFTAIFLPLTLFFIFMAKIPRQKKFFVGISYVAMLIGVATAIEYLGISPGITSFDSHGFWLAFNAFSYQMRLDGIIVLFLLPLTVGLFLVSRRNLQANSILVLIMGIILSQPILAGFTDQSSEPYRYMPLIIFFAMGVGTILKKRSS